LEKLKKNGIVLSYDEIAAVCRKYHIQEFSVFGSSLRDDFREKSDIDVLVSFGASGYRVAEGLRSRPPK
jgi:hypothetical protein